MIQLHTVNAAEQIEMNFDALECMTNIHFAEFIKGISFEREIKKVVHKNDEVIIYMIGLVHKGVLSIHTFDRYKQEFKSVHYNTHDLMEMLQYLGGSEND